MKPGLRQSRSLGDRPINRSVKVVGRDERIAIPSQPRHLRREEEALFVHCSLLQFSLESKHPLPNAHAPASACSGGSRSEPVRWTRDPTPPYTDMTPTHN